jgi:hypothetical protein
MKRVEESAKTFKLSWDLASVDRCVDKVDPTIALSTRFGERRHVGIQVSQGETSIDSILAKLSNERWNWTRTPRAKIDDPLHTRFVDGAGQDR